MAPEPAEVVVALPKHRTSWPSVSQDALGYFETRAVLRCVACGYALARGRFIVTMGHPTDRTEKRVAFFCDSCVDCLKGVGR